MNKNINHNNATKPEPMEGLIQDPRLRVPTIVSSEGYQQLSYLDSEEKKLGVELFEALRMFNIEGVEQPPDHAAVQARNLTYVMYSADPALYRNYCTWYDEWISLICGMSNAEILASTGVSGRDEIAVDPEKLHRYNNLMLMTVKVAHEYQDEWCLRLMSTTPAWTLTKEQYCCLGHPESEIWSEEERLILEFTGAVVNRTTTDALYARAEAFWGRKQLMRYISYIVHYVGLILMGHINVSDADKIGAIC